MSRGLVIGKFMPLHVGHLALIDFARGHCNELVVSMSYTDQDPIAPDLRYQWLQKELQTRPDTVPGIIKDDFDNELLPLDKRTAIWAEIIRKAYGKIDIIFSSESYGEPFAANLQARHVIFDQGRNKFPVSATQIRKKPLTYWAYIPAVVRPFFVKKICFYGPESTGKSTLARRMAERYDTEWVPEVARELLINNDFNVDQIITIGRMQTERVFQKLETANKLLMCDTDLVTTQIYSQHYLGVVPEVLVEYEKRVSYDHYFLLDIDVPWIPDGLRDLPHMRNEMMEIFQRELDKRKIPYTLVRGEREATVIPVIERMLND
jgi:HTH-type transcriptional regulator, transcriptional repressor of NAD biosynthesis genes